MDVMLIDPELKGLFTVKEAAIYLAVSEKTVYRLIHEGRITALLIGCRYKIEASELLRYINGLKKNKKTCQTDRSYILY